MIYIKKTLRVFIGTLIFIWFVPFFILIHWLLEDDQTMIGATKNSWKEYLNFTGIVKFKFGES